MNLIKQYTGIWNEIIKRYIIIGTYKFIETNSFTSNIVTTDILWIILYIIKKSIYIKWKIYSNRRKQKIKKLRVEQ